MTSLRSTPLVVSFLLFAACGGTFESGSRDDGIEQDGGDPHGTGGTSGAGGSDPGSGGAGDDGAAPGTGGAACGPCAAACAPGEAQIEGPEACPAGADCYEITACCSTIWCARQVANCNAYPACDPGDQELAGVCPFAARCYERSLCGSTIVCVHVEGPSVDGGAACGGDDHNRHYVGMGPGCGGIDYDCPAHTQPFENACGCGCAQDEVCPPVVDCTGPDPFFNPLCGDETMCPYSPRLWPID